MPTGALDDVRAAIEAVRSIPEDQRDDYVLVVSPRTFRGFYLISDRLLFQDRIVDGLQVTVLRDERVQVLRSNDETDSWSLKKVF